MNQARLLERRILVQLITDNPRGETARACYRFYREPFIRVFSGPKTMDEAKARELYVRTFPALCVELEENQGNLLGNGTLFSGLLLLGKTLLDNGGLVFSLSKLTAGHAYIDSDLLLHLLKEEARGVLEAVHEGFREPAGLLFCSQHAIEISRRQVLEDILEPYNEAMAALCDKIRQGAVESPMKATLFTYFYRIFNNKAKEDYRRRRRKWGKVVFADELPPAPQPENKGEAYFEALVKRLSGRLRFAENEKGLVRQLMDELDELCRKLLLEHHVEGVPLKVLGEHLNLKAPKKRAYDCRQKLRKLLN